MLKNFCCSLILLLVCSVNSFGQFNLDISKSENLEHVLDNLANKYKLNFAYPSDLVAGKKISPNNNDYATLSDFLSNILASTELEFNIQNNTNILLRQKIQQRSNTLFEIESMIYDKEYESPLSNASIYLDDFSKGTFCDDNGFFSIQVDDVDLEKYIIISYVGYAEVKIPVQEAKNRKVIFLQANATIIEDVIIRHSKPMMKTNLENMSIEMGQKMLETNQSNLLGGTDIFRIVQTLPGISSSDDSNSEIKIRGSNAEETLIIMDNIPIYNANHYYGVFGAINSSFVNHLELYKNIIPIEFTGVNAGLLKLESKNDSEVSTGSLKVNLLNASFNFSTPVNRKVVLNLAGRTTLSNVNSFKLFDSDQSLENLEDLTDEFSEQFLQTDPDFDFFDTNSNVSFNLSQKSNLNFSTYFSRDNYLNEYDNDFSINRNGNRIEAQENLSFGENWNNNGGAVSFNHAFSETLVLKAKAFGSKYKRDSKLSSMITLKNLNDIEINAREFTTENTIQDIGTSFYVEQNKKFKFGASWNQYQTEFNFVNFADNIREVSTISDQYSLFGSYTFHFHKLSLNLGNRLSLYQTEQSTFAISPQLLGTYSINEFNNMKFSFGRNNQFVRSIQFENRLGQFIEIYRLANQENIPVGTSLNYMLGYSFKKSDWNFDVELFYKDIDGALEFTNVNPGFLQQGDSPQDPTPVYRLFQGTSYAVGADFLISYNTKNYTSMLAYTISKTENKINELFNNNPYPNQNDRRHQLKWVNQIQLNNWSFSADAFFTSGQPYLSYIEVRDTDRENASPENIYETLPFYGRIDVGVQYSFPMLENRASVSCSIFNVTNRQNVKFIHQTYSVELDNRNRNSVTAALGAESNLLSRTIDVGFQYKF